MIITDNKMHKKMLSALEHGNDLYSLDDIEFELSSGRMQGHVEGDTWAITEVQQYPKRKVVHIWFVVGSMNDLGRLETKIQEWASSIGATLITAVGRDKWWSVKTPGWRTTGTMYAKDI